MSRFASLVVVVSVSGFAACHKDPLWCPDQPGNTCRPVDGGDDSAPHCTANEQCASPTPVCDLAGTGTCVQCVAPDELSACAGKTPACGDDHLCRACKAHEECSSGACLPDGSCGTDANVAYVDPNGTDNTSCTSDAPCTKVTKALATGRAYVKLHGTTDEQVSINNQNVTLLADPGAKLTSTSPGVILRVDGTSQVAIYDLSVSDGLGATGFGISMPTGNTAKLTLRRVKVSGNAAGGISISGGEFDIMNSIVATNGSGSSTLGGIKIDGISTAGVHRIEFTTISANIGPATVNTGITCGTVLTPVTFSSNIVYANVVSGGGKQIGGSANCSATYSDVGPDALTGTGNINVDPMFVNAAQGNFHIGASSPVKDVADPAATLESDIDAEMRPAGSGRDMGADEAQ